MNPPPVESSAELSADGKVMAQDGCKISDVVASSGALEFVREDSVLPFLPPNPIPQGNPLKPVAMSAGSAVGAAIKEATRDLLKATAATTIASTPIADSKPRVDSSVAPASAGAVAGSALN